MTYKAEEGSIIKNIDSYKDPTLDPQGPPYGFQADKLDRQAVKGLAPKYCYAFDSVGTTITNGATGTIALDTYTTNDQRMSATPGRITIGQAGLWIVKALVRKSSVYVGAASIYIIRNGSTLIDTTSAFYEEVDIKSAADTSPITNLCVPIELDQDDYIQIYISNSSGASCVYTANFSTLRVQSYVLY